MSSWHSNLSEASTERDVIAVCNRFVTGWTFTELGQLPAICQPKSVIGSEDVSPYALKLIAYLGNGNAATAPMLHRMSTFFTKAALRLLQITEPQPMKIDL